MVSILQEIGVTLSKRFGAFNRSIGNPQFPGFNAMVYEQSFITNGSVVVIQEIYSLYQSDIFTGVRVVAAQLARPSGVTIFIFEFDARAVCNDCAGNTYRLFKNKLVSYYSFDGLAIGSAEAKTSIVVVIPKIQVTVKVVMVSILQEIGVTLSKRFGAFNRSIGNPQFPGFNAMVYEQSFITNGSVVVIQEIYSLYQSDIFTGVRVVAAQLARPSGVTIFIFEFDARAVCNDCAGNTYRLFKNKLVSYYSFDGLAIGSAEAKTSIVRIVILKIQVTVKVVMVSILH